MSAAPTSAAPATAGPAAAAAGSATGRRCSLTDALASAKTAEWPACAWLRSPTMPPTIAALRARFAHRGLLPAAAHTAHHRDVRPLPQALHLRRVPRSVVSQAPRVGQTGRARLDFGLGPGPASRQPARLPLLPLVMACDPDTVAVCRSGTPSVSGLVRSFRFSCAADIVLTCQDQEVGHATSQLPIVHRVLCLSCWSRRRRAPRPSSAPPSRFWTRLGLPLTLSLECAPDRLWATPLLQGDHHIE
jgi:hypothetical protein